ncbi:opioid growth factor receptor conserved region-domain-containing protein [Camillea tinctor]|nr:opioid growth factor receptor conserved region-domain-containing protein [Camillea tinctor]
MATPPRPSKPSLRRLINFYDPAVQGPDARGRTLEQILAWDDAQLERAHDYIQLVFPLPEGSVFSLAAPILDEATFLHWRARPELQDAMRRVLARMLRFYGLAIRWEEDGKRVVVTEGRNFEENRHRWVCRGSHNHMRITRILRSLRVLGLGREAEAFYGALREVCDKWGSIGDLSREFWERAVSEPLYVAPDGEEVEWLEKYDDDEEEEEEEEEEDDE